MLNASIFLPVLPMVVSVGDTTNMTIPAVAAGVGVGVIAIALLARRRNKDDGEPEQTPPTKSKHMK